MTKMLVYEYLANRFYFMTAYDDGHFYCKDFIPKSKLKQSDLDSIKSVTDWVARQTERNTKRSHKELWKSLLNEEVVYFLWSPTTGVFRRVFE